MKNHRVTLLLFAIIILLLAVAWTFWPREKPTVGVSAPLPPAKEVRTVEKIIERPRLVYVYPDKVKAKLDLPKPVAEDPAKKVTTTGKLDAEERPYTLSTVLDVTTGESEIHARPDPLPWIGPGKRGAIGMAYGIKDGQEVGMAYAERDLLQIKRLHAGARAQAFTDGDWFAGGYVEYRF